MSIIIRLQNLAWAANSVDIRRFFTGLSIPEGGVHIVGGEKGDAFIAFSTDEDARLAMEKDGGKIKEMKIKLLLSSRTEMLKVIEQARQQNVAVQPADSDRRKGPGPNNRPDRSPSPRSRSRTSPVRDKRRSSKRERSRSRSRSPSRRSRDVDRRNSSDRFRRDDKRPDDGPQRYNRDDRPKKDTREHDRKNENPTYYDQRGQRNIPYGVESKNIGSDPVFEGRNNAPQVDPAHIPFPEKRDLNLASQNAGYQRSGNMPHHMNQEKVSFDKMQPHSEPLEKPRRKSRFEPEFPTAPDNSFFPGTADNTVRNAVIPRRDHPQHDSSSMYKKLPEPPGHFRGREDNSRSWPRQTENGDWEEKRPVLLNSPAVPTSKSRDFTKVVPMDIDDQNSSDNVLEKEHMHRFPARIPLPANRNRPQNVGFARNEAQQLNDPMLRNNQEPNMESRKLHGNIPERLNFRVQVKGLHPNASESDVMQLFRGIHVPPKNITLERGSDGLSAYVCFLNQRDLEAGLLRNMQFVGQNCLEVIRCLPFNNANINKHIPQNLPPRTQDFCVQLRGLPLTCNEDSIAQFLHGLEIRDIIIERGPDRRATGAGYVELGNFEDFQASLSMNETMMGHHSICVVGINKEIMETAKRETLKRKERIQYERVPVGRNLQPPPRVPPHVSSIPMCIVMRGLPENVTNEDISDFFSEVNVIPRAIHIMLKNKKPAGDAFAELCSPRDVDVALQQNGKFLVGVRVSVTPITFEEMSEIMGRPLPILQEQPPMPQQISQPQSMQHRIPEHVQPHISELIPPHVPEHMLLREPEHMLHHEPEHMLHHEPEHMLHHEPELLHHEPELLHHESELLHHEPEPLHLVQEELEPPPQHMQPRGPGLALLRTPMESDRPRRPVIGPGEHEVEPPAPRGRILFDRFPPPRGPRNTFSRMRGPPPRGFPRPYMRPDGPIRGPHRFPPRTPGLHSSERGPRDFGPPRFRPRNDGPPNADSAPIDFGCPGCVIGINNLHFRAGLEELLEFFDGYSISKDSIIRKYNENGQTTGEARVAFQNPEDAERAVRELNHRPIMGRPLSLCVV